MKKSFLGICAILAAVSACSVEEPYTGSEGTEVPVTVNLQLPADAVAPASKAFADGKSASELTLVVYENGTTNIVTTETKTYSASNNTAAITLRLIKGKTYDFVAWVQGDETDIPYTFNAETQTVTIDYSAPVSNRKNYDAFYAAETHTITGTMSKTLHAYRPFAQLNFGSSDLGEASVLPYLGTMTTNVTVDQVPTSLNLMTGTVEGSESVTFSDALIPASTEAFPFQDETYGYLSMNYILVSSDATTHNVGMTVTLAGGSPIEIAVSNVPLQRNYRTNIYGALLTNSATIRVTKETEFAEPDYSVASTTVELANALSSGAELVTLTTDLRAPSSILKNTTSTTIDLNGHTLTYGSIRSDVSGETLTIKNGNIVQTAATALLTTYRDDTHLVLENVTYTSNGKNGCVFNRENTENCSITIRNSTINGGYYGLTTNASTNPVASCDFILEGSTIIGYESAVMVNIPGTFTATNCTFTGGWQAVFVRGGEATFTNCTFNLAVDSDYGTANTPTDRPELNKNSNGTWSSGNQAETAALLVGQDTNSSYQYPITVTLKNASFSVTDAGGYYTSHSAVYPGGIPVVWVQGRTDYVTTLNYDDASQAAWEAATTSTKKLYTEDSPVTNLLNE